MSAASESRLATIMAALNLSAVELSSKLGVSNSLISRWQKGTRPLPSKGDVIPKLVKVLIDVDTDDVLSELLIPYSENDNKEQALLRYLAGDDMPGLTLSQAPVTVPYSGEYVAQQRILLGVRGFRKATLLMLDYLALLPPGQELTICAHKGFELWHNSLPFALQVLQKLSNILKRNVKLTIITHTTEGFDGSHSLSVFWLVAQLKGIIRTRYFKDDTSDKYFVASIKGHWSARVEHDETAEDNMISTLYSDARNIREDEAHVAAYITRSIPAGQFDFLQQPEGSTLHKQVWKEGPLPMRSGVDDPYPDGSFSAICRVPSFGIMSQEEWSALLGTDAAPDLPPYIFTDTGSFADAPHKIILCKEDVQEGLSLKEQQNVPLSVLQGHAVAVPRNMLVAMLYRLLDAMDENPEFELALMPKSAFEKLELELVTWNNSVSLGWLQSGNQSLLSDDPATCLGFANAVEHVWEKLHKGWKRSKTIKATLRKWLAGEDLDHREPDSPSVRNWDVMP